MPKTWTRRLVPLVLVTTFSLGGCAQTMPTRTAVTDPACIAWGLSTYSSKDTEETQKQVRATNAARAVYCGE